MFVFEITTPGTWVDHEDRDWAWRIQGLLRNLQSEFFEANAALNLFVQTFAAQPAVLDRASSESDAQRRSEIKAQVEAETGHAGISGELWHRIHVETEVRFKREQWSQGRVPCEFQHAQSLIYAKAFLHAIRAFDKFLRVLARETGVPPSVAAVHTQIAAAFPDLRGVNDLTRHPEDRARRLDRRGHRRNLQPIESQLIEAPGPGGALALSNLSGSKVGSTMEDGHYGEVDISPESMQHLQRILQEVLNSFQWRGPRQHSPSV